ncbi:MULTISPECIES: DnaB-like helicase N-terminal domain-containing protein [unclassified Streptomyces]|uniref:DnaB-like helicase N-terminal domain-containing protein n=1 Tax=unclassified Streptomyces TaxID=2593676 RepID=UPI002E188E66|nr:MULTISPECIES: DnaB-like helicase N-terminal domain-containing protein [unclassified Streptomyces]
MADNRPNTPSRYEDGPESTLDAAEPPYNVDAERAVLGACMHDSAVIDAVRPVLGDDAFYRPAHETIWRALLAQHREDKPTDPIVLTEVLQQQGDLQRIGGPAHLHQLANALYGIGSAEHHAQIVRAKADLRRLLSFAVHTVQRAREPGADPEALRSEVETEMRSERERALASGQGRLSRFAVDGWCFVRETGADAEPLWGTREQTIWAPGESLMIVGAPGVGKTTLAHQVIFARLGLQETVLEMPVAPSRRVLYLAMDRPKQIAKAMARRVFDTDEKILRDRLVVWQGPLPATLDKEPDLLADLAAAHQADTIVIDSLKDAVSTMVDDSLAVAFHNARMRALRGGVEILELHHQRKATADAPRGQRPALDQVYGSTWLTAGAGSVLFVTGRAGDPAVTLHHLKTPTGEIGPLDVTHDHKRGTTTVDPSRDPAVLLRNAVNGMTVRELAATLTGGAEPERADVEKARRHLTRLVDTGLATRADGIAGGSGGGQQARYYASARHLTAVG